MVVFRMRMRQFQPDIRGKAHVSSPRCNKSAPCMRALPPFHHAAGDLHAAVPAARPALSSPAQSQVGLGHARVRPGFPAFPPHKRGWANARSGASQSRTFPAQADVSPACRAALLDELRASVLRAGQPARDVPAPAFAWDDMHARANMRHVNCLSSVTHQSIAPGRAQSIPRALAAHAAPVRRAMPAPAAPRAAMPSCRDVSRWSGSPAAL